MFCPEPPHGIDAIVVDAWTADGRRIDPYNEVASRYPTLLLAEELTPIPARLGQDQLFSDFTQRLARRDQLWLLDPLSRWIRRYHERTGDPNDRITRFRIYAVISFMPRPGSVDKHAMIRKRLR
jgi:hypothetical protein